MTGAVSTARVRSWPAWSSWLLWSALTVVLAVGARHLPWRSAMMQLEQLDVVWVVAAIAANFAIIPLWALEWRLLVPLPFRVALPRMFEIVSITASVLNSIPYFAGEISAVALLIARAGLTRAAALSILALDQLLVAFAKVTILGVAATVAVLPDWLRAGVFTLVAGFVLLLGVVLSLAHSWDGPSPIETRRTRRDRIEGFVMSWGRHLDAMRDGRRAWRVAGLALAKKVAEVLAVIAVQVAFGMDPSPSAAILVIAALAVTTLLPLAPANLGVYEATVFATYRYLGVPADSAVGLAIVQHLCFLLPALATGYAVMTARQIRMSASPR